jgi:hypothetical protein
VDSKYRQAFTDYLNSLTKEKVLAMNNVTINVDGIKISGKIANVKETLKKLGYNYYESDSKGLVLVSQMDDCHLRNAIIKRSKEILDGFRLEDPQTFANRIVSNGLNGGNDKELMVLCMELRSRYSEDTYEDDDNYDLYEDESGF